MEVITAFELVEIKVEGLSKPKTNAKTHRQS